MTGHSSANRFSTSPYLSSALSSSFLLFPSLLSSALLVEVPSDYISIRNILATCSLLVRKAAYIIRKLNTVTVSLCGRAVVVGVWVCGGVCVGGVGGVVLCFRVTSMAQAACLLEQGLLDHQKVGASPLAMVIRSRHSDGPERSLPCSLAHNVPPLKHPVAMERQLRPFKSFLGPAVSLGH